jgi:hypothetical protein
MLELEEATKIYNALSKNDSTHICPKCNGKEFDGGICKVCEYDIFVDPFESPKKE